MLFGILSSMPRKSKAPRETTPKIHVSYVRLPNQVKDLYDELIYRSRDVVIGRSLITSTHSVTFDGEVVLAPGFQIVFFELKGKWFSVGKIRNLEGRHTGYYCDIVTPFLPLEDGGIELTDLFLDLWVSPHLRYEVLDEEELRDALEKGWIGKELYERANKELAKLINLVKGGKFPPRAIKDLEGRLSL